MAALARALTGLVTRRCCSVETHSVVFIKDHELAVEYYAVRDLTELFSGSSWRIRQLLEQMCGDSLVSWSGIEFEPRRPDQVGSYCVRPARWL